MLSRKADKVAIPITTLNGVPIWRKIRLQLGLEVTTMLYRLPCPGALTSQDELISHGSTRIKNGGAVVFGLVMVHVGRPYRACRCARCKRPSYVDRELKQTPPTAGETRLPATVQPAL